MSKIRCQSCAIIRQLASEYSDPSIVCPECKAAQALGKPGMPMSNMARRDDDDDEEERPKPGKKKGGGGMSIAIILGVVGVVLVCCLCTPIGVVGVMFVPSIQNVREAAARTQSTNNLKMVGLSFHAFHDANKRLPFNGSNAAVAGQNYSTTAKGGDPFSGSWAFQILPYMDQLPLYANPNKTASVNFFMCPGRARP